MSGECEKCSECAVDCKCNENINSFIDFETMPFHGIEQFRINGFDFEILFKSGYGLVGTAPNQKTAEQLKEAMVKNLGVDKVIIDG